MSRRQLTQAPGALLLFALLSFAAVCQAGTAEQRSAPAWELPSDTEMIAHFQAHRAEFEELVRLYQTDQRRVWRYEQGNNQPFETAEYRALLKRTGVRHLSEDGAIWLPNPYAPETAQQSRTMDLFHAYAHHGIMFYVENMSLSSRVRRLVWKQYFYVPVVPKIENSQLRWPLYFERLHRSAPVLTSLDEYPPDWLRDPPGGRGCVYRQIEAQWFLSLCRSR